MSQEFDPRQDGTFERESVPSRKQWFARKSKKEEKPKQKPLLVVRPVSSGFFLSTEPAISFIVGLSILSFMIFKVPYILVAVIVLVIVYLVFLLKNFKWKYKVPITVISLAFIVALGLWDSKWLLLAWCIWIVLTFLNHVYQSKFSRLEIYTYGVNHIYYRAFFFRERFSIPKSSIQTAKVTQNPLERLSNRSIGDVRFGNVDGHYTVDDIPDAEDVVDLIMRLIENQLTPEDLAVLN